MGKSIIADIMDMGNKPCYFDMHSHILPAMDDGCKNCDESAQVLQMSLEQGVVGVMATPHYYPKETVADFLERRQWAYEKLKTCIQEQHLSTPMICLGAEVAYHSGLIYEERLADLCLGKSKYFLLELPFSKWSPAVLRDVQAFRSVRGFTPIIAHLERYRDLEDKQTLGKLLDCDVLIQMNAEYFLYRGTRRKAKKWLQQGVVQIMGSDCHNISSRSPNLGYALLQMSQERLSACANEITDESRRIFEAAMYGNEGRK